MIAGLIFLYMRNKKRDNEPAYFSYLPAHVRYDEELTPNAKLMYSELTALTKKEGYCWASNEYFATLYKVSESSVSRWISQLIEKGYIESEMMVTPEGTERRIYMGVRKIAKGGCTQKDHEGVSKNENTPVRKNAEHNNILSNNTVNNSTSLTGSLFPAQEEAVDKIVTAEKAKRKKVAPKKEKASPDPAYNPCKDIWNEFMKSFGLVPDFPSQGKALTQFLSYLREFIRQKEGHEAEPEYVVEAFNHIFTNRVMWGTKFFMDLREIRDINRFKVQIIGNVYNGGKTGTQSNLTADDVEILKNIGVKTQ